MHFKFAMAHNAAPAKKNLFKECHNELIYDDMMLQARKKKRSGEAYVT